MPRIALLARLALLVGLARGYLRPGPLRSFEPVRWLTDRAVDPALGPPLALGQAQQRRVLDPPGNPGLGRDVLGVETQRAEPPREATQGAVARERDRLLSLWWAV